MTFVEFLENSNICPLYDDYLSLDKGSLEKLGKQFKCQLPSELQYLFGNYGCSKFDSITTFTGSGLELPVNIFYGKYDAGYDVFETLEDYEDDAPKGMIPFADNILGDLFFISVNQKDCESVYYWNHELNIEADGKLQNPIKISNSLLEFFIGLTFEQI